MLLIGASPKSSNNFDGLYTLKSIESSDGEIKNFVYGGELKINNSTAIFKTHTNEVNWDLTNLDCKITESGFSQIDSETNDKYIFERID